MTNYCVREDITLLYFVEADSKEAAIKKAKERSVREFDEVDSSPLGISRIEAELDDQS